VVVGVVVGAEAGAAGFGASCFWHPANRDRPAIPRTTIRTDIFFMIFTSLFPRDMAARACRDKYGSMNHAGSDKDR